jgi:hypothetical protein
MSDQPLERPDIVLLGRAHTLLAEHRDLHDAGERPPKEKQEELHQTLAAAGGHLYEGRIPMTELEHDSVDKLVAANSGQSVSLTRRDPGDTGPVLVHVGDDTYQIDDNGRTRKLRAA